MFRIALRNIFRHKVRSLFALLAIAFGCSVLIFTDAYFEDIYFKLREHDIHSHTGHLQIFGQGALASKGSPTYDTLITNASEIISSIKKLPGVAEVKPRLSLGGLLGNEERSVSFYSLGVDPQSEPMAMASLANAKPHNRLLDVGIQIIHGQALSSDDRSGVVLGKGLAESVKAKVGDPFVLLSKTTDDSPSGMDVHVRVIYLTGTPEMDNYSLRLPIGTAQKILQTSGIQNIVVLLKNTEDTDLIKNHLTKDFAKNHWPLEIRAWYELSDYYTKARGLFQRWFFIIRCVILAIVMLSIYNTMSMSVAERTTEIGTLMALGKRSSGVKQLFLWEGGLLGGIGGMLGLTLGGAYTWAVSKIGIAMPPPPGFSVAWVSEPKIVLSGLVGSFALIFLASLVSSLFPAARASQLEIAEALRYTG